MLARRIALPVILAVSLFGITATAVTAASGHHAPVVQCQEDDPCWDCHSLGNRVCGPANDTERADAWKVWDYSDGPRHLTVDPSRAFRVEYVGNALDWPRDLTESEVALPGKDNRWYVFRADYTK
jgi:hypothetical protein